MHVCLDLPHTPYAGASDVCTVYCFLSAACVRVYVRACAYGRPPHPFLLWIPVSVVVVRDGGRRKAASGRRAYLRLAGRLPVKRRRPHLSGLLLPPLSVLCRRCFFLLPAFCFPDRQLSYFLFFLFFALPFCSASDLCPLIFNSLCFCP